MEAHCRCLTFIGEWRCSAWLKPWFVCSDTQTSHHYKRDVSSIRSSFHRRHISPATHDMRLSFLPDTIDERSADAWIRLATECGRGVGGLEWEKWLDVVRRLERANDEMWCVWTANNVRMRSTKMKFNESNVRFNLAWVSACTPHRHTHTSTHSGRSMWCARCAVWQLPMNGRWSGRQMLLFLRFESFVSFVRLRDSVPLVHTKCIMYIWTDSLVCAFALWNLRSFFILVHFPMRFFSTRSFCVRYWLIRSYLKRNFEMSVCWLRVCVCSARTAEHLFVDEKHDSSHFCPLRPRDDDSHNSIFYPPNIGVDDDDRTVWLRIIHYCERCAAGPEWKFRQSLKRNWKQTMKRQRKKIQFICCDCATPNNANHNS